ncbi:MAG: hypothetical protein JWP92_3428 [Caulobacter sp.]|nr:hypothetical protein [Caulobacter sp.]
MTTPFADDGGRAAPRRLSDTILGSNARPSGLA